MTALFVPLSFDAQPAGHPGHGTPSLQPPGAEPADRAVAVPHAPLRIRPRWVEAGTISLVLMLALGLLMALHHVVSQSTERAALHQAALREHADALWRCRLMSVLPERRKCIGTLMPMPSPE
jgi:hypothetical protein